ncbi:hypothetical protein OQA88_13142, partial [Cercophora sp. LCS_1]
MMTAFYNWYGPDWDIDGMIDKGSIELGHPSFKKLGAIEAAHRAAAFLQSWLYLGLLEAVIAAPISSTSLVRAGTHGTLYHYSRMVPVLLTAWAKNLPTAEDSAREALEAAVQCSLRASSYLTEVVADLSTKRDSPAFSTLHSLLLSVEPALSALHEAIATFASARLQSNARGYNLAESPLPRTYSENLVRKGWCRFVVANAEKALSAAFMRFADTAGFVGTTSGHASCVAEACRRNNLDTSKYVPGHLLDGCRCRLIKPKLAAVLDVLENDRIPVVRLDKGGRSLAVGSISPRDDNADYVAFSHVWADGLGSTSEVGLPSCQAQNLHLVAKRHGAGGWFWIDALCVPKQQPHRGKAIKLMNQTYRNAAGVILLDQGLRSLSSSRSDLEIAWSVFASGWFGRVWTYQEGYLARWVEMELHDGTVNLYDLIQRLYRLCYERPQGNPFPSVFVPPLLAMLQKARPLDSRSHKRPRSRQLVDLFNALTRRQTSRPTDQFLVIGLLLGVDVGPGMALDGEERWKDLYLRIGKMPWTVVFDERPKMATHPFCWAPSTWISAGGDRWLHYDDEEADITEQGLVVTLKVLVLEEAASTDVFRVVLATEEPHFYELSCSGGTGVDSRLLEFDTLFVRYFQGEDPEDVLYENRATLLAAGLGLRAKAPMDGAIPLEHDFTAGWEVREIVDMRELEREDLPQLRASWT